MIAAAKTVAPPATATHQRIRTLDGVRGLAIILVLFHHGLSYEAVTRGDSLMKLAVGRYGWMGVDLFFVLSGFLITGILLDTKESPSYFRSFYMRRVLRIFPLFYGALALFFFVLPHLSQWAATAFPDNRFERAWYWLYAANYHGEIPALGHFWSLCIEEQFYLVWPLTVWLCSRKALLRVCAAIVIIAPALRFVLWRHGLSLEAIHFYSITRADSLIFGAFIAILTRSPAPVDWLTAMRNSKPAKFLFFSLGAMLLAMYIVTKGLGRNGPLVEVPGLTIIGAFFAGLIVVVLSSPPGSRIHTFFSNRVLRRFGKYSYGMYVFNWPLVMYLHHVISPNANTLPPVFGSGTLTGLFFCLGTILLTYLIAAVSYHLFEIHFLNLKDRFEYEKAAPLPAAVGAPL